MNAYHYRRYAARAREAVRRTDSGGLYRSSENGMILGVCAGLAEHFGVYTWIVRIVALAALWMLTLPVMVAYLILGMLLPERPLAYAGDRASEKSFWKRDDDAGMAA